ncbi:MAG TPA: cytochrome c [Blastocatellia bacterium]
MSRIRKIICLLMSIAWLAACLGVSASPLNTGQAKDPNARGRQLYLQYCASCHGADGKGGGPAAAALKVLLNDLTTLERREGRFNHPKVRNIISGEMHVLGHGAADMPVWGRIFRHSKGTAGAGLDLYALSKYLESIQKK